MSTSSSIVRRIAGATLAATAAVALTACDSDQIGAAAVVGGERITVSELQERAEELIDAPDSGLAETNDFAQLQRDLLTREIQSRVMAQVAEDAGIEVTDAQVDDLVGQELAAVPEDQDVDALLAQSSFTLDSFRQAARTQLIADALIGATGDQNALMSALDDAAQALGVEVNPRYGEWDSTFAVADVSGSIAEAADSGPDAELPGEMPGEVPGQAPGDAPGQGGATP